VSLSLFFLLQRSTLCCCFLVVGADASAEFSPTYPANQKFDVSKFAHPQKKKPESTPAPAPQPTGKGKKGSEDAKQQDQKLGLKGSNPPAKKEEKGVVAPKSGKKAPPQVAGGKRGPPAARVIGPPLPLFESDTDSTAYSEGESIVISLQITRHESFLFIDEDLLAEMELIEKSTKKAGIVPRNVVRPVSPKAVYPSSRTTAPIKPQGGVPRGTMSNQEFLAAHGLPRLPPPPTALESTKPAPAPQQPRLAPPKPTPYQKTANFLSSQLPPVPKLAVGDNENDDFDMAFLDDEKDYDILLLSPVKTAAPRLPPPLVTRSPPPPPKTPPVRPLAITSSMPSRAAERRGTSLVSFAFHLPPRLTRSLCPHDHHC